MNATPALRLVCAHGVRPRLVPGKPGRWTSFPGAPSKRSSDPAPSVASMARGKGDTVGGWDGSTDGQLVATTLQGEPEAYGELVRRHQSAVYNVVYRLVGERQAALDLTQDAFVRAYYSLRT